MNNVMENMDGPIENMKNLIENLDEVVENMDFQPAELKLHTNSKNIATNKFYTTMLK